MNRMNRLGRAGKEQLQREWTDEAVQGSVLWLLCLAALALFAG